MKSTQKIYSFLTILFVSIFLHSCSNDDEVILVPINPEQTPTEIFTSTAWETTGAKDQNGNDVPLTDPRASNFVGYAYFKIDGTFNMFFIGDDSPKMQGDWSFGYNAEGTLQRTIHAKNNVGRVLFTRVFDVTVLNSNEFTYRVPAEDGTYVDIIHTPTNHTEPVLPTPTEILTSTPWLTTEATDQNNSDVSLDDPRASNFVGYAYFRADGTFNMYNLDDSPKMQGDWSFAYNSEGILERTIVAKSNTGQVLFTRVVEMVELNDNEFTYRVEEGSTDYVDIIHTPTNHTEPTIETPTEIFTSISWLTTGASDQNGNVVALDDNRASNFVGYAYFNIDGTFKMYNLDDSPKMQGDWSFGYSDEGILQRTIIAKNDEGEVMFTRVFDVTVLNSNEFTYRVPSEDGTYVDIIHTPTDHPQPNN